MHDIDRTLADFEPEMEFEADQYESDDLGFADTEAIFDDAEEMELAAELLSISDEADLDQFIGEVFSRIRRAAGRFARSDTGRALGGIVRSAARQALPHVGRALGSAVGGPLGGAAGARLAAAAGRRFGLELEGLSPEDQEFELARAFVRFAGQAAKNAARASSSADPRAAARSAAIAAAR
jgi:hypothetical protein